MRRSGFSRGVRVLSSRLDGFDPSIARAIVDVST